MPAHYEVGRLRVGVSMSPALAQAFSTSIEELLGQTSSSKRGLAPKVQRHMEGISQLPKNQQRFLLQIIERALAQAGH